MIGNQIYSCLTGDPTVAGLIGDRCYPLQMPQNTPLPGVTYQVISRARESEIGRLYRYRIQISAHDKRYADVHSLADAAVKALERYQNRAGGRQVFGLVNESLTDAYDAELDEYTAFFDVFAYSAEAE